MSKKKNTAKGRVPQRAPVRLQFDIVCYESYIYIFYISSKWYGIYYDFRLKTESFKMVGHLQRASKQGNLPTLGLQ